VQYVNADAHAATAVMSRVRDTQAEAYVETGGSSLTV
jgi:hypothetical protein